jgi:hypothetical protein
VTQIVGKSKVGYFNKSGEKTAHWIARMAYCDRFYENLFDYLWRLTDVEKHKGVRLESLIATNE